MQAGDVTESQPDVAVYAAKYPDPVFPLELLTRILSFTMEHDTVYDPCVLLRTRDSARLVHSQFKSYVDARPEFWSHIVVTIDDDPLVLSRVLESTGSSEFSLTIRMVDFSTLVAGFADGWFDRVEETVAPLMELLDAHMERCYALNVQTANEAVMAVLLEHLQWMDAHALEDFTVSFGSYHFSHFRSPSLMEFTFADSPLLQEIMAPFTQLSFVRHAVPDPVFTYASGRCRSLTVHQPVHRPFSWPDLARIMDATPTLCVLTVDGIFMGVTPSAFMIPVAFNFLHTLEVNFRGNRSTACIVAHLNAPQLRTLKVKVQDRMDMVCLAVCTGLLWDIKELVIQGHCEDITGVDQVFRLMHRLVSLDLRGAGSSFLQAFHVASLQPPRSHGPNWNACPALRHLLVSNTHVGAVVDLLEVRMGMSYARLDTVHFGLMADDDDIGVAWFQERSINSPMDPLSSSQTLTDSFSALSLTDPASIHQIKVRCEKDFDVRSDIARELVFVLNSRRQAYIVCRGLGSIDRPNPVFLDALCPSIDAWTLFSGTKCSLDLQFLLFRADADIPCSEDCTADLEQSLRFASTILPRCRKLSIHVDDLQFTPMIVHHFSTASASNLEALTLERPPVSLLTRELIIFFHNRPFLGANLTHLAILRLLGFAVDWDHKAYFGHLTALVLQDFQELDGTTLLAALQASSRLQYAALRNVHCSWTGKALPRVLLPGLQELDVILDGDTGLPTLLGLLEVFLTALYVTTGRPVDLAVLTKKCPNIVGSAEKIAIRGNLTAIDVRSVLDCATIARILDLSYGGADCIFALFDRSISKVVDSLCVSASSLPLVSSMLEARASNSASSPIFQSLVVCDVIVQDGGPGEAGRALYSDAWARIAMRVADFSVVSFGDSKPSFDAQWITDDGCIDTGNGPTK
ncbi:hypothetical protein DFH06DRAFT_1325001 [Mycena polygramma]|nr:hypothetical protein DFH06DRAFT_1325001 [Mycena polygramma]